MAMETAGGRAIDPDVLHGKCSAVLQGFPDLASIGNLMDYLRCAAGNYLKLLELTACHVNLTECLEAAADPRADAVKTLYQDLSELVNKYTESAVEEVTKCLSTPGHFPEELAAALVQPSTGGNLLNTIATLARRCKVGSLVDDSS